MSNRRNIKVIFDTNIWISFLIGKRLQFLTGLIAKREIIIIFSDQLLLELRTVTKREKLKKYFPEPKVEELVQLITAIGEKHQPIAAHKLSRDPKDDFLLDLVVSAKAHYLVTGDQDLLALHPFAGTQILSPADFEKEMALFHT